MKNKNKNKLFKAKINKKKWNSKKILKVVFKNIK